MINCVCDNIPHGKKRANLNIRIKWKFIIEFLKSYRLCGTNEEQY